MLTVNPRCCLEGGSFGTGDGGDLPRCRAGDKQVGDGTDGCCCNAGQTGRRRSDQVGELPIGQKTAWGFNSTSVFGGCRGRVCLSDQVWRGGVQSSRDSPQLWVDVGQQGVDSAGKVISERFPDFSGGWEREKLQERAAPILSGHHQLDDGIAQHRDLRGGFFFWLVRVSRDAGLIQ